MDLSPTTAETASGPISAPWLREHLPWEYGKGLPPRFDDLADEVAFGRGVAGRSSPPTAGWA